MKNVFKKLAFVLALAMAITLVAPAATASAATAPSFKKVGKILYVNGDVSETISGTYRFYFNNAAGYTAKWESENKKVATVSAAGKITAVAPGTTKIVATLTNKKTGKSIELKNTVWVKQNATEVGFGSLAATKDVKVGDSFKVNVYRAVNGTKVWTQTNVDTITDSIVWTSSDETVATVNKWGTVKVLKAGEVTITASATQAQGNLVSASKSYKLTIAEGITSAKVVELMKAEITFGSPVTQEVANTLTMKNSKGANISSYIKSVTLDKTGTVATVETFVAFENKEVYTFAVKGFDATYDMPVVIGEADSVVITNDDTVVLEGETKITWNVLDANGIVIAENTGNVTLSLSDSSYSYLDTTAADKTIRMFKEGEATEVTLVYHTGKYDENWKEITFTAKKLMKCVKDTGASIVGDVAYVVVEGAQESATAEQFATGNKTVPMNETNYFLNVKATNASKEEVTDFTYESLDSTKLFVNPETGKLVPIAEGTVAVRVTKGNDFSTVVNVTVGAKVVPTTIVPTTTGNTTLSNADVNESVSVKLTVNNQYSQAMAAETVVVEAMQAPTGVTLETAKTYVNTTTAGVATFAATGRTAGVYTFKLTMNTKFVYVTFTVVEPDMTKAPAAYKVLANNTTIDTTVNATSELADDFNTDLTIVAVDAKGVAMYIATGTTLVVKDANGKTIKDETSATETSTDAAAKLAVTGAAGEYNFNAMVATGTAIAGTHTKVTAGTYTVTGTVTSAGIARAINPVNIIVKDSQKAPAITVEATTIDTSKTPITTLETSLAALFKAPANVTGVVTYGTVTVNASDVETTYVTGANAGTYHAVVKYVNVTETLTEDSKTVVINHKVALNRVITITVK